MLLLAFTLGVKANPVDITTVREVAEKFIKANTKAPLRSSDDLQLVKTYSINRGDAAFYIFNTPNGFIIVSADDCATPVLAYSDRGRLDVDDMPVQMQGYLNVYLKEIEYGMTHRDAVDETIAKQWELVKNNGKFFGTKGNRSVGPLLGETIWNQGCYYNGLCPEDENGPCGRVYAGCVATAMGQVMHYWGYPVQGSGSYTYTPSGYPTQTADFGNTVYEWGNMPAYINSSSPAVQKNAIATLLWHCGISVDMMYSYNGSGAYSEDVPNALINYFNYSDEMYGEYRNYYSYSQWVSMLKTNLDLGYPMYYSGSDTNGGGGHAFVCDGYDDNDMFWFNWGWSGNGNAYFAIDALNVGSYQFNNYNYALFNIHPAGVVQTYEITATANPTYGGTVTGSGTYNAGLSCTLTANAYNDYSFVNWTKNGVEVSTSPSFSFIVTEDATYTANFELFAGITIGDGGTATNQYLPSYSFYCYTLSQQIYTADEIGTAGIINSVAFYNGGAAKTRNLDIYLVNTDKEYFSSSNDWIPVTADALVYSGEVTMFADTWTTINFNNPFFYDNTTNLALIVDDNTGSWTSSPNMACRVFPTNNVQAIRIYSDPTDYDPFDPSSYSGTTYTEKNQLRLVMENEATGIVLTPEAYDFGDCPNGYTKQTTINIKNPSFSNTSVINSISTSDSYFQVNIDGFTLPLTLAPRQSFDIVVSTGTGNGNINGNIVVNYDDNQETTVALSAFAYTPQDGDIWESAIGLTSYPFNATINTNVTPIYNNYNIPPTSIEDGADIVYKLTFAQDTYLNASVTSGENGKVALYAEDFGGYDGPGINNNYRGPVINNPSMIGYIGGGMKDNESYVLDENFDNGFPSGWTTIDANSDGYDWVLGSEAGGIYLVDGASLAGAGHNSSADMICSGSYSNYIGGAITPDNYLVSPRVNLGGILHFWACAQDASYAAEHFGVAVSTTSNNDASAFVMIQEWTLSAIHYQPTGPRGSKSQGQWYEYTVDLSEYTGIAGYFAIRHFNCNDMFILDIDDLTLTSCEPDVTNMTVEPGTYYLVASSTSDVWSLTIEAGEVPCPEEAVNLSPANYATVNPGFDVTLNWAFGARTTEYKLMFGTTEACENTLVDWTRDLCESYTLTGLADMTDYYWRVVERNDGCPEGVYGPVSSFYTKLGTNHLYVYNSQILVGGRAYVYWSTPTRNVQSYNVYVDGNMYASTTDTYCYLENLSYNMAGYEVYVTCVYDNGESDPSNSVYVYVSGDGNVEGFVYEQDGVTPISNAKVNFNGSNEFGGITSASTFTDANGRYVATLNAGYYVAYASCNGYQNTYYDGTCYVTYSNTTPGVNILLNERFNGVDFVRATTNSVVADIEWGYYDFENSFEENFDNGMPEGWTTIDANYDGYDWVLGSEIGGIYLVDGASLAGSGHNSSADMMCSGSYSNATSTAITPDNYLVSPQVTLGGVFSFWACAQDASYAAEHFGVAVSTTNNTDPSAFSTIDEWTLTFKSGDAPKGARGSRGQGQWYQYTVDLSAYAGQSGFIAIRHFNCTDMFILDVDDVVLASSSNAPRSFSNYKLYRTDGFNDGPYTTENTELIVDNISATTYTDNTFGDLSYGIVKYGVSCVYEGNRGASTSWAELVQGVNIPKRDNANATGNNSYGTSSKGLAEFTSGHVNNDMPLFKGNNSEAVVINNTNYGTDFCHFTLNNPENLTSYGFTNDAFTRGACYMNGKIYFADNDYKFGIFDPENGVTVIATDRPYETIEYNPVDGKMYGASWEGEIYEVNPYDGSYTLFAQLPIPALMTFTITNEGRFIICDADDETIKEFVPETGELVNLITVDWNINWGQDMAMDRETNEVYWAACNATDDTHPLIKVDLLNNELITIGYFETQKSAFATFTEINTIIGERESAITWSNILERDMYLGDGAVNVTVTLETGESPQGTVVSFTNRNAQEQANYPIADVTLDATGTYSYPSFRKGDYIVRITKAGYAQITVEVSIWDNISLSYELVKTNSLIFEPFEDYAVGEHIAIAAQNAGNDWWTTWNSNPGSSEDGYVALYDGHRCGHLTYGNDQVLLLGDEENGVYDLEFDILVPNGKDGYFNILHNFAGPGSTWALESYLHMEGSGSHTPGTGAVLAGGSTVTFDVVYDAWMHFRLHVDTDTDMAAYYYTAPGENEMLIYTWQWSLDASGSSTVGRKLAAMNFYPAYNATYSEYYLDNFVFTKVSGESAPRLTVSPNYVDEYIAADDIISTYITIDNSGSSIGEWMGWIDYGMGADGDTQIQICYDASVDEITNVGFNDAGSTVVELGAMYPGTKYASAMGTKLVSAQYYMCEINSSLGIVEGTPLTFRVYGQGMNGQPSSVIAEKTVPYDEIVVNGWTVATFDTPIDLTGYDVWVTCEMTQCEGGYPLTFDNILSSEHSAYYRKNGYGTFSTFNNSYGDAHIRMNCVGTPLAGSWAALDHYSNSISIGSADYVNLTLSSIGLAAGTYNANVVMYTNDIYLPYVEIPVQMTVLGDYFNITVTANPLAGGSVSGGGSFLEGTTCWIEAYPNPLYDFVNWTKNGVVVSTSSYYSFIVTGNAEYVANFEPKETPDDVAVISFYDVQSNASLSNRIATWDDGTAAFVATMDISGSTSFSDRGTGYNYYDGTSLGDIPTERIENARSGWPSIAPLGNGEILASHTSYGVNIFKRPVKGEGEWNQVESFDNWSWPRIATTHNGQYVHTVFGNQEYNSNTGNYDNQIAYSRSTDNGDTWSTPAELPLVDVQGMYKNNINSDQYVIATNGDRIAILFAGRDFDLFYIYSENNGETWTKQVVAPFPYGHALDWGNNNYSVETDTIFCVDNNASIAIDNNGVVHVAFGLTAISPSEVNSTNYVYWNGINGIVYWNSEYVNEQGGHEIPLFGSWSGDVNHPEWANNGANGVSGTLRAARLAELAEANGRNNLNLIIPDENHDGVVSYDFSNNWGSYSRSYGVSTMPAISVDETGNMIIAYNTLSEERISSYSGFYNRSCLVTARDNQGNWFYDAINLSEGIDHIDEEVYYVTTDGQGRNCKFWVMYGADNIPDMYIYNNYQYELTANYYYAIQVDPSQIDGWGAAPLNHYQITAMANPAEGGTVTGGGNYVEGATCTLTATPNEGYEFFNWTKDGEVVSTNSQYTFVVNGDGTYVANFSSYYHWDVNIYEFPDNLYIVGVISILDEEQFTDSYEIGAFVNNHCRGRERPVLIPMLNRYIVNMMVYGEIGDQITFRLYDHATEEEVDMACLNVMTFEPDVTYGSIFEPYVFDFGQMNVEQSFDMLNGWNWVSTYIELGNIDGLAMLEDSLHSNCEMIASQTAFTKFYGEQYGWFGSLTSIVNEKMYRLKMSNPTTFVLSGEMADPSQHPITMVAGWNHIGYISNAEMSVTEALSGMSSTTGDLVKTQTAYAKFYGEEYGWYGSLNTINPGDGLMYKSNNDNSVTFVYPQASRGDMKANLTAENNHWVPDMHGYQSNMTVMAVVELNGKEIADENYELAVFADGECRGSVSLLYVEPIDRYVAFLTITGDDDDMLGFGLYDKSTGNENFNTTGRIVYHADDMIGGFENPMVVTFGSVANAEVAVYPNPAKTGETVNVVVSEKSEVEIINALGEVVGTQTLSKGDNIVKTPATPGVYMLRIISNGNDVKCQRIVLQ